MRAFFSRAREFFVRPAHSLRPQKSPPSSCPRRLACWGAVLSVEKENTTQTTPTEGSRMKMPLITRATLTASARTLALASGLMFVACTESVEPPDGGPTSDAAMTDAFVAVDAASQDAAVMRDVVFVDTPGFDSNDIPPPLRPDAAGFDIGIGGGDGGGGFDAGFPTPPRDAGRPPLPDVGTP